MTPFLDVHSHIRVDSLLLFAHACDLLYTCTDAGGVLITDIWRKVNGREFDDSLLLVLGVSSEVRRIFDPQKK